MKPTTKRHRALTRGTARIVQARLTRGPLLGGLLLCAGLVFGGGYWLGARQAEAPLPLLNAGTSAPERHFTIDRLGELAGRLQSLEADTQTLQRLLDEHNRLRAEVSEVDPELLPSLLPGERVASAGQGGALLAPIGCDSAHILSSPGTQARLRNGQRSATCLRSTLDLLMAQVADRNAALMAVPSRRPVEHGRLGSLFGNRVDPFNRHLAFHSGVDFALPRGTPVHASAGGRVSAVGWLGGYGRRIEIDHGNGLVTRYAHLSAARVKLGQVVVPGEHIGAVGSTGRSTGPHLHFEVIRNGQYVDPQRFLALGQMERDSSEQAHD